ncbi:MAG TPA: DUF2235 domain-containing protein, partial [Nitrospirales bacterium]|nr:DUF2235 domain-containing protein [Nitrospirales bacterium]
LWAHKPKPGQTIEQVWFSGAHSDVGGGYPECGLSDITLDWMVGKARGAGLIFDDAAIKAHPLHPNPLAELHNSKTGLYRVTAGIDRGIGFSTENPKDPAHAAKRDDPTQTVHDSVRVRWDNDRTYRPASVREYFKRIGDRRGDAE